MVTIDELNIESKVNRIENKIEFGMSEILRRNYNAFSSFVTKAKECNYSEYFTYASKLPKSQRFGKSTMILSQMLNLIKYQDFADKFKPLRFKPQLMKIDM